MLEKKYRGIIGLDLDGTLLDPDKVLRPETRLSLEKAIAAGYCIVPVTGRPFGGLPAALMEIKGIHYAVTANGAAIYRIDDFAGGLWHPIHEDMLADETVLKILDFLEGYHVIPDCMVEGHGTMPAWGYEAIGQIGIAPAMAAYLRSDRRFVPDLKEFVRQHSGRVCKMTVDFFLNDGGAALKESLREPLKAMGDLNVVSGGVHNLEITNRTAAKGLGILTLARLLDVDPARTMACGDDGNDLDMIRRAAFGAAMANAAPEVREQADYVTDSNERNGAGKAIEYFMELMDR